MWVHERRFELAVENEPAELPRRKRRPAPGKVTRTMSLPPPVQRRVTGDGAGLVDGDHAVVDAAAAVAGSGERLPHFDQVQRAFGHHDLSDVRAHHGAEVAAAAHGIGAEAYATGTGVGFARTPSLHTVVHEAVHVLQQRAGGVTVQGLGAADDAHERQADAIADRVVAGENVTALLDAMFGTAVTAAAPSAAVQRRIVGEDWALSGKSDRSAVEDFIHKHAGNDPLRRKLLEERILDDEPHKVAEVLAELQNVSAARGTGARDGQWQQHMAALLADLEKIASDLAGEPISDGLRQLLDQAAATVMLYQAHIASFIDLNPMTGSHGTTRQENPFDRQNPGFYYRSQAKDHPQFVMLKDLLSAATAYKRGEILPPYNPGVEQLVRDNTSDGTKAKKTISVTHPDENLTIRKKGEHSELAAAHLGLRQTNAAALVDAMDRILRVSGGASKLGKLLVSLRDEHGMAPTKSPSVDRRPVTREDVGVVLDQVVAAMGKIGALDPRPKSGPVEDEPPLSPGEQSLQEDMLQALTAHGVWHGVTETGDIVVVTGTPDSPDHPLQWAVTPSMSDAFGSESYVTRKIEQASLRADELLAQLKGIKYLRIGRVGSNAQITVEIPHEIGLGDKQVDAFTTMLRVFLWAEIQRASARRQLPLGAQQRQSFGSSDTSLADTGPAIRISIGTEPPLFFAGVAAALLTLDQELAALVQGAKGPRGLSTLYGVTGGNSVYQSIDSPTIQRFLGLKVIIKGLDLGGTIAYIKNKAKGGMAKELDAAIKAQKPPPTGKRKKAKTETTVPSESRPAVYEQLMGEAQKVLASLPTAQGNGGDPMADGFPIAEHLQNALVMVGTMAHRLLEPEVLDIDLTPAVRRSALNELQANLLLIERLLDEVLAAQRDDAPTGGRAALAGRIHADLRNATEDLIQSMLVLLSTTTQYVDQQPEDGVADLVGGMTGNDAETYRTDSGEQAGNVALIALQTEARSEDPDASFDVSVDSPRLYFEFSSAFDENDITVKDAGAAANVVMIDPRPYETNLPQLGPPRPSFAERIAAAVSSAPPVKKGQAPRTILIDTTGTDHTHPELIGPMRAAYDAIKAGRVRFVLFNSGVKHEQNSTDRYQQGRITVVGPALANLKHFSSAGLVTQLLGLFDDLRNADGADLSGGLDVTAIDWPDYDAFMEAYGVGDWAVHRKAFDQAQGTKDAAGLAKAAEALLDLYRRAIDELVVALAHNKDGALKAYGRLPPGEQRTVQDLLLASTESSSGGKKGKGGGQLPGAEQPVDGGGIPNIGNSCYISAALNLIAFTGPYRQVFAARPLLPADPLVAERAQIWAVLEAVRGGQVIAPQTITALRAMLAVQGVLLPPSLIEQQRGEAQLGQQQDPEEVFFRRVIPHFAQGGNHQLELNQQITTNFHDAPEQDIRAATADDQQRYTSLDGGEVWQQNRPDPVLALSIHDCGNLAAAVQRHLAQEQLEDVGAIRNGRMVRSNPTRQIALGNQTPTAITIALQRLAGPVKDDHAVNMPDNFPLNGFRYDLAAVIHHHGPSVAAGHYTASTPTGADGAWQHRNDEAVTDMSPERAAARRSTGYLFSYVRGPALGVQPIVEEQD